MLPTVKTFNVVASMFSFVVFFALMTIVNTVIWEYTAADLYDCTDPVLPGYLSPGDWVHAWDHHPVAVVRQVVHDRSMSEPDTIKEGWSVPRLWCLWWSFAAVSFFVSLVSTILPWLLRWLHGRPASVHPYHLTP